MCRFIAYIGNPIVVDEVLYKPKNSLIRQSYHAREMEEPLNGDGFGIGWYAHDIDNHPGVFRSTNPAWSDANLKSLAPKIRSHCFLAHIRAASTGAVSLSNCHPFQHGQMLFMHNGDIGGFQKIKRKLRASLSDQIYNSVEGQTDSEHFFALIQEQFLRQQLHFNVNTAAAIMQAAVHQVTQLLAAAETDEPVYINGVLTNGHSMVVIRYVSKPKIAAPTLYYTTGSRYEFHNGVSYMYPTENGENEAVLVASEKLDNHKAEWNLVPENHIVLIDQNLQISTQAVTS